MTEYAAARRRLEGACERLSYHRAHCPHDPRVCWWDMLRVMVVELAAEDLERLAVLEEVAA